MHALIIKARVLYRNKNKTRPSIHGTRRYVSGTKRTLSFCNSHHCILSMSNPRQWRSLTPDFSFSGGKERDEKKVREGFFGISYFLKRKWKPDGFASFLIINHIVSFLPKDPPTTSSYTLFFPFAFDNVRKERGKKANERKLG